MQLDHNITVYVPSTQGLADKVDAGTLRGRVEFVSKKLAGLFGGATATDGQGAYISDAGELVTESVKLVSAFASEDDYTENITQVYVLASQLKEDYGQEAILVSVDGKAFLI